MHQNVRGASSEKLPLHLWVGKAAQPLPEHALKSLSLQARLLRDARDPLDGSEVEVVAYADGILSAVIQTANEDQLPPIHRGHACNTLSTILDACKASTSTALNRLASPSVHWQTVLDIYLHHYDDCKMKAMKKLFQTLILLISREPESVARQRFIDSAAGEVVAIILRPWTSEDLRPALHVLDVFLAKNIVSWDHLGTTTLKVITENSENALSHTHPLDRTRFAIKSFSVRVMHCLTNPDSATIAGSLLSSIFLNIPTGSDGDAFRYELMSASIRPILTNVMDTPEVMDSFKQHFMRKVFASSKEVATSFMNAVGMQIFLAGNGKTLDSAKLLVFFNAIEIGKSIGLVSIQASPSNEIDTQLTVAHISVDETLFHHFLGDCESSIRAAVLSCLVLSPGGPAPFSSKCLQAFQDHLDAFFVETDSKQRNDFCAILKRLLLRLHSALSQLEKQTLRGSQEAELQLKEHRCFLQWLLQLLNEAVLPTSNYQRQLLAVKTFSMITQTQLTPTVNAMFLKSDTRCMLDLLFNRFEDIRTRSAQILQADLEEIRPTIKDLDITMPESKSSRLPIFNTSEGQVAASIPKLELPMTRAKARVAETCRADHSDGLARLCELQCLMARQLGGIDRELDCIDGQLFALQTLVAAAETDLNNAVAIGPLNGYFTAMRYALCHVDTSRHMTPVALKRVCLLYADVVDLCRRTWITVSPAVCVDTTEELGSTDISPDLDIDTRDILSYSWRAVRESSLLLRLIVTKVLVGLESSDAVDLKTFESVGDLTFTQLGSLRHRGAFTTVAQTFSSFCSRSAQLAKSLPVRPMRTWYDGVVRYMYENSDRLTRRSGGLPAILVGVLCAASDRAEFDLFFEELLSHASIKGLKNYEGLPQVHALNCIKEAFKTPKLEVFTEPRITECLDRAVACLQSPIWAIRNCGLMLFRALIDRILPSKNLQSRAPGANQDRRAKLSLGVHSKLPQILLNLLGSTVYNSQVASHDDDGDSTQISIESIYLALDIVSRGGSPPQLDDTFRLAVAAHFSSPRWQLRQLAASVYASLMGNSSNVNELRQLLQPCDKQNITHARLVAAKTHISLILSDGSKTEELEQSVAAMLHDSQGAFFQEGSSLVIQAAYIDLLRQSFVATSMMSDREGARNPSNIGLGSEFLSNSLHIILCPDSPQLRAHSSMLRSSIVTCILAEAFVTANFSFCKEHVLHTAKDDIDAFESGMSQLAELLAHTNAQTNLGHRRYRSTFDFLIAVLPLLATVRVLNALLEVTNLASRGLSFSDASQMLSLEQVDVLLAVTSKVSHKDQSQDTVDHTMELNGLLFSIRVSLSETGVQSDEYMPSMWLENVILSARNQIEFDVREASLLAIQAFFRYYSSEWLTKLQPRLLLACAALTHDFINDDDEDLRVIAASLVSLHIGNSQSRSATPLAADRLLQHWIMTTFGASEDLYDLAVRRLMSGQAVILNQDGLSLGGASSLLIAVPTRNQLEQAMPQRRALFEVEKQNLYLDLRLEARYWQSVLLATTGANASPPLADSFVKHTVDGLQALLEVMKGTEDGALGWSTGESIFAIGCRVFYSAEAILTQYTIESAPRLGTQMDDIRALMQQLYTEGTRTRINSFWLGLIERCKVLAGSTNSPLHLSRFEMSA